MGANEADDLCDLSITANQLGNRRRQAWLAEFSPLSDPSLVPATVAAAVGLELNQSHYIEPPQGISDFSREDQRAALRPARG